MFYLRWDFFSICLLFSPKNIDSVFFRPDIFVWWAVNTQHASLTGFHLNCKRKKIRKKNFISFYLRYWILQQKRLYTSIAPNQIELNHITSHFIDEYVNPHVTATSFSTLTTELFEFCDVHVMLFLAKIHIDAITTPKIGIVFYCPIQNWVYGLELKLFKWIILVDWLNQIGIQQMSSHS